MLNGFIFHKRFKTLDCAYNVAEILLVITCYCYNSIGMDASDFWRRHLKMALCQVVHVLETQMFVWLCVFGWFFPSLRRIVLITHFHPIFHSFVYTFRRVDLNRLIIVGSLVCVFTTPGMLAVCHLRFRLWKPQIRIPLTCAVQIHGEGAHTCTIIYMCFRGISSTKS